MEVKQLICDVCEKEIEIDNDLGPEHAIINKFCEIINDGKSRKVLHFDQMHLCKECFHKMFPTKKGY